MPMTRSHPCSLARAAPSITVVVRGLGSTLLNTVARTPAASSRAMERSSRPERFVLLRPVTIRAWVP